MEYAIKDINGIVVAQAVNKQIAQIISQALRESDRDGDYTAHPV